MTTTTISRINAGVVLVDNLDMHVTNTNATDNRGALALSGVVSGAGRIIKTGDGEASVAGSTNTFTGGVSILGGTYRITGFSGLGANPASFVSDRVIIDGGTLRFDGSSSGTQNANVGFQFGSSNATIRNTNSGIYTIAGTISGVGQLTKAGSGILYLNNGNSAANTYSGGTIIEEGELRLGRSGSMGTGSVQLGIAGGGDAALLQNLGGWTQSNNITVVSGAAGTLRLGSISTGNFNTLYSGSIAINGDLEITASNPTGFALRTTGVLSGAGDITKVGSGEWRVENANNTYSGAITVTEGTLAVSGTGSLNSAASISVQSGARFAYNSSTAFTGNLNLANGAIIGGSGSLAVDLGLNNISQVLSPGNSPGILSLGTTQNWSSFTYDWEINEWGVGVAGVNFDQIAITGSLNLSDPDGIYQLNITAVQLRAD